MLLRLFRPTPPASEIRMLALADGRVGAFDCGFTTPLRQALEVVGSDGVLRVPEMWLPGQRATWTVQRLGGEVEEHAVEGEDQIRHMIEDFGRAVLDGEPVRPDPEEALATMALRYFRGHGPAPVADFAGWTGLPVTRCRRGVAATGEALIEVVVEGVSMFADRALVEDWLREHPASQGQLRWYESLQKRLREDAPPVSSEVGLERALHRIRTEGPAPQGVRKAVQPSVFERVRDWFAAAIPQAVLRPALAGALAVVAVQAAYRPQPNHHAAHDGTTITGHDTIG